MAANKGNNPEVWEKLLATLDERLQLGLLDHLKRINSYHFEGSVLFIEPGSNADFEYLNRKTVHQQFETFAKEVAKVERIEIKKL